MVKFLHTADWQIGMKAAHVGAVGAVVRNERLHAAKRVIDAARQHAVQFILVAGDTFENNAVDRVLVQKVADILASFAGPVYIIPGNHDPLAPGCVWEHPAWRSHANVHVLVERKPLDVAGATLWPSPLREKHSPKDPTRWMDARESKGVAIGVAHGTVEGVTQDELDYPIVRDAATRAGLDYLALGHWHSTANYEDAGGAVRMAYSGTHEATRFGEPRSGNVLVVEIPARGGVPNVMPVRTGGLNWRTVERDVREPGDLAGLRGEIEQFADVEKTLLDVRLNGILRPDEHDELTRIDELVRARFLYSRIDSARLLPAPQDDNWLADLPVGVIREVAGRLKTLSDPAAADARPDYATPEVAARALLDLYRMTREANA
jgi:DNA repair exonuclease SbcCD nuclease subunit